MSKYTNIRVSWKKVRTIPASADFAGHVSGKDHYQYKMVIRDITTGAKAVYEDIRIPYCTIEDRVRLVDEFLGSECE